MKLYMDGAYQEMYFLKTFGHSMEPRRGHGVCERMSRCSQQAVGP